MLQILAKSRIGSMYSDIGQYSDGLEWLYKAEYTSLNPELDAQKNIAVIFFNIGLDYNYLGKFDSAAFYADKTIAISKASENLTMLAYGLGLRSYVYSYTARPALAERPMNESVALLKQIGNLYSVINVMSDQAKYYAITRQPEKGIQTCLDALELIKKFPIVPKEVIYDQLAENYRVQGNYTKYAETLNTIIRLKDSTYKKNSVEALAAMSAKYDVFSKEAFIAKQKLELLHKDIWIAGIAGAAVCLLAIAYFLFKRYRRRQRMALAAAEEKEHRRIAADLHDNIGAYASAISANVDEITNSRTLNAATLSNLKSNATEIISSLRDTIWALNKESVTLTNISDRIKIYVQKMQPSYPHVQIGVEEAIDDDIRLSPVQALHLFRIIQEALNNALRHSQGAKVHIGIQSNAGRIAVAVKDDGKGFDPRQANSSGNGLSNMRSRATESGFVLSLERGALKGMTVSVHTKVNK